MFYSLSLKELSSLKSKAIVSRKKKHKKMCYTKNTNKMSKSDNFVNKQNENVTFLCKNQSFMSDSYLHVGKQEARIYKICTLYLTA